MLCRGKKGYKLMFFEISVDADEGIITGALC